MKKLTLFLLTTLLVFSIHSCKESEKIQLFNGENLDNWTLFVGDTAVNPGEVFYVEDGLLKIKGKPNGYIRTKGTYSNYILHVDWRWVEEPANSGVLLHAHGPDMLWPLCIEAQLMNGNAGDFVLIGEGSGITVQDTSYLIEPGERMFESIPKFEESSEKPAGEWNTYEIKCTDDLIELKVNGVLQNRGTDPTFTQGNICIQSEGGPMEIRRIELVEIQE